VASDQSRGGAHCVLRSCVSVRADQRRGTSSPWAGRATRGARGCACQFLSRRNSLIARAAGLPLNIARDHPGGHMMKGSSSGGSPRNADIASRNRKTPVRSIRTPRGERPYDGPRTRQPAATASTPSEWCLRMGVVTPIGVAESMWCASVGWPRRSSVLARLPMT